MFIIKECPVCYETKNCKILNCKHHLCTICFEKWCEINHNCPICRSIVITSNYPDNLVRELYFLTGGKLVI